MCHHVQNGIDERCLARAGCADGKDVSFRRHRSADTGNSKPRSELNASFTAAKEVTAKVLGESARTFTAETESGVYYGRIIGETDLHVVQRISGQTAVAHMKSLFDSVPQFGSNVGITYARDLATVRDPPERVKAQELAR